MTHSAPPPRAKANPWIWIGGGAAALVLVIVVAVMLSGGSSKPVEPVAVQPPPKPPPLPPKKPDPPPAPVAPPPAPPPRPVPVDPLAQKKAEMAQRAQAQREEGARKLDEARKAVDRDLENEKKEAEEFARRFADFRLDARLTSGATYAQALVTGFSPDELQLKTAERGTFAVPWSMVAPETTVAAASHVYRNQTADEQIALARFFVERRLWKDADAALKKAKSLDSDKERLLEEFEEAAGPLLTGTGLFKGSLRTLPPSGLRLTYDFTDPDQGGDFDGPSNGFKIEGGKLEIEASKRALWRIGDAELAFGDDLEFEAKASVEGTLLLVFHARAGADAYYVETGPSGSSLKKGKDRNTLTELVGNDKSVLKGEQKIRLSMSGRRITFRIGDRIALTFNDASGEGDAHGAFYIGVAGGKAVLAGPLVVGAQVNPEFMKKQIGTVEMRARRVLNQDLAEVHELNERQRANVILGGDADGVSADGFVPSCLEIKDIPTYEEIKVWITGGNVRDPGKVEKEFEEMLTSHPEFPSIWYLHGIRHLHRYQLGEAREKFSKAIELFPDFHEAHYQLAMTWWYAREFTKSLELANQALKVRPDYANALILAGRMRFAADKSTHREADRDFRVAEKLNADAGEMLHERRRVRMLTRGPRDLGCVHEFESPNYKIVTDISPERARWYASQLEVVRSNYLDAFKQWYKGDPRPKPRIAIFNTREAFYTYTELCSTDRRENLLGFFDPANNELVLFEDLDLSYTLQVLYHEAFHHFASAMLKFPPYWWNEGIAEYMSAVRLDPEGKAVKERAIMLAGRLANMKMSLKGNFFVPFEKIINYNPGEFYSGAVWLHYAQAWTMIHFFYEFEKGKYRPLIEKYFDELLNGKNQRQAFDAVFKGKTSELEKEWREFTQKLKGPGDK